MILLTWHEQFPSADKVKKARDKFFRLWRDHWGEPPDAWVMEMQRRGTPHYHLFSHNCSSVGRMILDCYEGGSFKVVDRVDGNGEAKQSRRVLTGNFADWVRSTWLSITGEEDDPDARYFTSLGMVELFDGAGAGAYAAKLASEVGKECQKQLPEAYKAGLGRWWHLNKRWHPKPQMHVDLGLGPWPWDVPVAHVWKAEDIAACITAATPVGLAASSPEIVAMCAESFPTARDQLAPKIPTPYIRRVMPRECDCHGRAIRRFCHVENFYRCPDCGAIELP
jgi:hypothetical protein